MTGHRRKGDEKLAKTSNNRPPGRPELVNHAKPPAYHVKEAFENRQSRNSYQKPVHAARVLRDNNHDLWIPAAECPELKAFLNTILRLCDGQELP